ncbi:hypothetical protein CEXT_375611 [Caerostris extrusa]|uniref:Uncharacterized protein n=1 Tax=Caerostris extrusa TaxID=172846 RepID=A0AAV4U378_CAEEX|nr:hypothetical protein CEXT_375611 [Caerostris extrusa]
MASNKLRASCVCLYQETPSGRPKSLYNDELQKSIHHFTGDITEEYFTIPQECYFQLYSSRKCFVHLKNFTIALNFHFLTLLFPIDSKHAQTTAFSGKGRGTNQEFLSRHIFIDILRREISETVSLSDFQCV